MAAPLRIRVSLIDPDSHYRLFLASCLNSSSRHRVLQTAESAASALQWPQVPVPHVMLVEADLPDLPCGELIRKLRNRFTNTLFIVLTTTQDEQQLTEAIQAGVVGYVLKSVGKDAILEAIDEALAGGSPLSLPVARHVLRLVRTSNPPFPAE
ncbi:response regulator [Synoicihabitans lomoniglobus]|uniref:Response regulator n=1 Tax=Synoicihabitans lomoniglobus TaxID=2909285 RepID=A0AAF0CNI6_9BACT|nr:response regulator [Opitutaceae bacterium LMO-M01]WED65568.1 response regulator [Opitutaceae bacterium LMO-M01]